MPQTKGAERSNVQTPVLIVGGGPVGLGIAIDLGLRSVPSILVDETNGEVAHPRTGLIAVRTMELARSWGISDRIRKAGFPDDYELSIVFCTSLNGHLIAREPYPSMANTPTPPETPEKKQRLPQSWMQPILANAAHSYASNKIMFRHKFEGFEKNKTNVRSTIRDIETDEVITVSSDYLLACDGASSGIRNALGIEMRGRMLSYSVNVLFKCHNLTRQHKMGEAERYIFTDASGTWGNMTVIDGKEIWRLTVLGSVEKIDLDTFDAAAWVRKALGDDQISFDVISVVPWRRSEMIADKFIDGRVILLGDAVHTTSPTGGMGMNTGMQEVLDLGWKLEAVIKGWGGPYLLQSYEVERRPVAARNLRFSTNNYNAWRDVPDTRVIADDSIEGQRLRDSVGQRLRESTLVEWESLGLQIGHRYDNSPICIDDGSDPVEDDFRIYIPTSRPGSRAPHAWLQDGRSTLDLFGKAFVLLTFDASINCSSFIAAFDEKGVPIKHEYISDSAIAKLYERKLVLVRPDGHVAWRGDSFSNSSEIVEIVRGAKSSIDSKLDKATNSIAEAAL